VLDYSFGSEQQGKVVVRRGINHNQQPWVLEVLIKPVCIIGDHPEMSLWNTF